MSGAAETCGSRRVHRAAQPALRPTTIASHALLASCRAARSRSATFTRRLARDGGTCVVTHAVPPRRARRRGSDGLRRRRSHPPPSPATVLRWDVAYSERLDYLKYLNTMRVRAPL